VAPEDEDGLRRAALAAEELLDLAAELGGSLSGEHGIGTVKREAALRHTPPPVLELQRAVKRALDPKGLFNPGKRL
jgi:glycolate oxidase